MRNQLLTAGGNETYVVVLALLQLRGASPERLLDAAKV